MLVPGIERRREQTALLPFQSVFLAALVPDRRRALALQNEDRLLVHMALGLELAARRDLLDHRVAGAAGAVLLTKAALPPLRCQSPSFSSSKSGMMKSLINRDLFPLLINFVRTLVRICRGFIQVFHGFFLALIRRLHIPAVSSSQLLDLLHVITERAAIGAIDGHRIARALQHEFAILRRFDVALEHLGNILRMLHVGDHVDVERNHSL